MTNHSQVNSAAPIEACSQFKVGSNAVYPKLVSFAKRDYFFQPVC